MQEIHPQVHVRVLKAIKLEGCVICGEDLQSIGGTFLLDKVDALEGMFT